MQTFRSQSSQSNNASDIDAEGGAGIKKAKYVPYIPGETNLENTDPAHVSVEEKIAPTASPTVDQIQPDQIFAAPNDTGAPQQQYTYTAPQANPVHQAPVYYADPQYMHYVQNEPMVTGNQLAMNGENFRKMIIGLFGSLFILFIILIIAFSGKNVQHKLPPDVLVFQPQAQERVLPPFTITGQARGYWFFNNEFPVIIYDSTNTAIAYGVAETDTDTDTNTDEFFPFTAVIKEYTLLPAKKRGYILFQRSTGDLQEGRQNTARVPIRFADGTGIVPISQIPDTTNEDDEDKEGDNENNPTNENPDPMDDDSLSIIKQCEDGIDNDNDGSIDMQDVQCHTDGNASNSNSYDKKRRESPITVPTVGLGEFTGNHNGFVTLYFPNTTDDPLNPSCSRVFPTRRELSPGPLGTMVEKTLRALLLGPTAEEGYVGFTTGMKRGMGLDRIELVGDTLAIYLTSNSIVGDPSWCTLADIKKQFYQTMVQFAGVNNVRIYANGQIL